MSHFGVNAEVDARLQRPELLGTGSTAIVPHPVPNTTGLGGTAPNQGDLAAVALGETGGRRFVKSFTEHGILMLIASVRAELSYQFGLPRMFSRETRFDFFWPDFALLGEQPVLSREIYADGTGDEVAQTGDYSVWGYQPRYEEMRHRPSMITGEFRSQATASLDVWHLGLDFGVTRPVLNAAFIVENPPVDRIVQVPSEPELLVDAYFNVRHVRPMPTFATPGLTRF